MQQKLKHRHPALVKRKGPTPLHDNARPHVSMIIRQKLLEHPPFSPDLSPTDFHFFKHLDNCLQEKYFRNSKNTEKALSGLVAFRTTTIYDSAKK